MGRGKQRMENKMKRLSGKLFVVFFAVGTALAAAGCGGGGGGGAPSNSGLRSGQPVSGSIKALQWRHYSIDVPAGAQSLSVAAVAETGEYDLLVKFNQQPDEQMYNNDEEDCYDWAEPDAPAFCLLEAPQAGKWYISLWGTAPTSQFGLVAQVQMSDSRAIGAPAVEVLATPTQQQVLAARYLKRYRKGLAAAGAEGEPVDAADYPQSGTVEVAKGDDLYRFYFGADAVTPSVLSIDHNGVWMHYDSWSEFEAALQSATN
jgi:hypothetical protein